MRVAIVHDYLTQRGGAERVVLAISRAFPDAPIHTSLFDPDGTFPELSERDVRPMPLNRAPGLRRRHRLALPALAPAFSSLRVDADVVICSSSGWAHGVRTPGRKLVYCHNPARWLYQRREYARRSSPASLAAAALGGPLRRWDRRSARSAERYLANSSVVRERIRSAYGIEAEILPPPVALDAAGPARAVHGCAPGYVLCVSRLLRYKNVGAVVAAFARLPSERLVVVGTGPEEEALRRAAASNVRFFGRVEDDQLRWLYARCAATVAASFEDFGLTPLEGAAFGRPAVVLRFGGFLDSVHEGRTGVFFDRPESDLIAEAVSRMRATGWDRDAIARHAQGFSEPVFATRLRSVVSALAERRAASGALPG